MIYFFKLYCSQHIYSFESEYRLRFRSFEFLTLFLSTLDERIAYRNYLTTVLFRDRLVNYQPDAIWKCYGEVQNQKNACQVLLIKNQLKQSHVRKSFIVYQ